MASEPSSSEAEQNAIGKSKHWSFEPLPEKIAIPSVLKNIPPSPVRNPIDAFVANKPQLASLSIHPAADRVTLARRASLALTGGLTDAEMVQHFVQSKEANAYEDFVESLLASPKFGEQVATKWIALTHYAETRGLQNNQVRDVFPYRDWFVTAINQDLPYDQFISWQLAGDMLPNPSADQRGATSFNHNHQQTDEGSGADNEQINQYMADRVERLGTAITGISLRCSLASCDLLDNLGSSGIIASSTDALPRPLVLKLDNVHRQKIEMLEKAMASIQQAYSDEVRKLEKSDTVENWYGSLDAWPQPDDRWLSAEFFFDEPKTEPTSQFVNRVHADQPGCSEGSIQWQEDRKHSAVMLDGINSLVFPKAGVFSRTQEFTISFGLKVPKFFDRAVVLHRSDSWSEGALRGYQLIIDDGHFCFDLAHHWPSSAIRIRCSEPVPLNHWLQIALVYGGTNRAEDTHLYIDGKRAPVEIMRDSLRKDFLSERVDVALCIGARKRDLGLAGGLVDDLQVYDTALTAIEIAGLATDEPWLTWPELSSTTQALWREHYARRMDPHCKYHIESFQHYFKSLSEAVENAREMVVVNQALLSDGDTMPTNRLELARWLTNNRHPLTARVAVNQIWHQMFGRGLVVTAEDFGVQGQPPTHPELLDYLARELVRSGWSRKSIFRSIATSQVFMSGHISD